jgi:hypothetical protein
MSFSPLDLALILARKHEEQEPEWEQGFDPEYYAAHVAADPWCDHHCCCCCDGLAKGEHY